MSGANEVPRQLIVLGDSGVHGWGDREAGGWCQRLRLRWMNLPSAPVVYPLGIRGDGLERWPPAGAESGAAAANYGAKHRADFCSVSG